LIYNVKQDIENYMVKTANLLNFVRKATIKGKTEHKDNYETLH